MQPRRLVALTLAAWGGLAAALGAGLATKPAIAQLTHWYALTALVCLYLALLHTPLYRAFPKLPLRGQYYAARRPLGVAAFCFGAAHAALTFFGQLRGFDGLAFLSQRYLVAVALGVVSVLIMLPLALTANDRSLRRLGPRWKQLHRLVYLVGLATLFHTLLLGDTVAAGAWRWVFVVAVFALTLLQAARINAVVRVRAPGWLLATRIALLGAHVYLVYVLILNSLRVHGH
ncbi:MAG: ferric reductase-like transmembrane domain-containing protein [Candidatus Andersenbacteria bacterium]